MQPPNSFQKLIHQFAMLRPVTMFFSTRMHRFDGMILKLSRGSHTFTELLGWPVIQLITKGAKSEKTYELPLVGLFDDEKIALIASSFGRRQNPGWYYNLIKHPECGVHFNGRSGTYIARESIGEERERYWQMAVSLYKGYDAYKVRAAHRQIPVMILEPLK
jgi:deazaflavin-dependent oxidoreductase (nitroreductase family)